MTQQPKDGQVIRLLCSLRSLVAYLRESEHWPVKSEHMAYLDDAEQAIRAAARWIDERTEGE